jgi:nucleotide-binding universal stress UspA family protein
MSDTYIVGFDGTEQAQRAVNFAAGRARQSGGQLHLVHVIEWSPYSFHTPEELAERHKRREQELDRGKAMVQPVVDDLEKKGVKATCEVRHGHAGDLLCEIAAERKAAQIIIGRTGDSALSQRLLGGLAITLVQVAPVPVTIVP